MEFKFIFYAIAFVGWLFFKYQEQQKELLKKRKAVTPPSVVEQVQPPVKPFVQKPIRLPQVKKPFRTEQKNKNVLIVEKKEAEIFVPVENNFQQKSVVKTPTLIDEIRGGEVDWRKAIVLSEILRPV